MENQILLRSKLNIEDTWKLEDIYASDDLCEKDIVLIMEGAKSLSKYDGKLDNGKTLFEYLNEMFKFKQVAEKVYSYAHMREDQDGNESRYKVLRDKALNAYMMFESMNSFFTPELLSLSKEKIDAFYKEEKELELYRFLIDDIMRSKEHTLSKEEEKLISNTAAMSSSARSTYEALCNTDIVFGSIIDENKVEIKLTQERFPLFLESKDRSIRKKAYDLIYKQYLGHKNTIASLLNAKAKTMEFNMNARKFTNMLSMCLFGDNISVDVYKNLINTVKKRINLLHEYVSLRKKALDLDKFEPYDMYVALSKDTRYSVTYTDAKNLIVRALSVLGDDYSKGLMNAFSNRWIDPIENEGKRSGAYATAAYGVHPYVLMNWQGNMNSLFTLAHELGHAMHFDYAHRAQPYVYSNTPIFIAEVASTVNEVILVNYMIREANNENEKAYLLEHFIKTFVSTLFRQTLFAEFELKMYETLEKEGSLTYENMTEIYSNLLREYYGEDYTIDENISIEWARIPHFYSPFYVYQYATGYSAAVDIASKVANDQDSKNKYIDFLKAGNSDYPVEILKIAGVDMSTSAPVDRALDMFEAALKELAKAY